MMARKALLTGQPPTPEYFLQALSIRNYSSQQRTARIRPTYCDRGEALGVVRGRNQSSQRPWREDPIRIRGFSRHFSSHDDQFKYIPPKDPWKKDEENGQTKNNPQSTGSSRIGTPKSENDRPSDFFISHITSGGTPCDPAPAPFQLADFGEESLYTLVLLRHGESEWNKLNRYTGWVDVNLTAEGKEEARSAGRLLYENGIEVDHAFTSVLRRASFSCNMALNTARQHWVPVTKTWRLNERHYGALQGYNKDTAFRDLALDQELVMQMRRSYDVRPPIMQDDHPYWHGKDRRYVFKIRNIFFWCVTRHSDPHSLLLAKGIENYHQSNWNEVELNL